MPLNTGVTHRLLDKAWSFHSHRIRTIQLKYKKVQRVSRLLPVDCLEGRVGDDEELLAGLDQAQEVRDLQAANTL